MVLWEDTKKWVDQIKKASTSKQQFLQDLLIDEHILESWYRYCHKILAALSWNTVRQDQKTVAHAH